MTSSMFQILIFSRSKIGKLGIDKVSVTSETQKLEASIESLRKDQTQIAADTATANEACQSHIIVDPTELEGLQGILDRLVLCHGWAIHACDESVIALTYDGVLLVRFDKIDGVFDVRVSILPVCF
jgi:hypothetical protein